MLPISEIGEKYNKKRMADYFALLVMLLTILIALASFVFNDFQYIGLAILFYLLFSMIIVVFIAPNITTFESIRYHLTETVKSLKGENGKKSEYHLNELAYNVEKFNTDLESNFILNSTKINLTKFYELLKYQVYPSIKDKEYSRYFKVLTDIDIAFQNKDISGLNKIFETAIVYIERPILLPYEKPHGIDQIVSTIYFNFHRNFVFRFSCLTIFLLIVGYLISMKTSSLEFNTTLISTLILLALGISKETK